MRKFSPVLLIMLMLFPATAVEISAPIRWHSEGYLLRYVPRSDRYFLEGTVDNSIDMLKVDFGAGRSLTLFLRATVWTGMGYQCEDVIFDPRDMHYSLVPGFRGELGDYALTFQWLHDCFHEVDRKTESTIIWNAFEFRFSPQDFIPENKIEKLHQSDKVLTLFPSLDWEIYFAFYPKLRSVSWFQYMHPFSTHTGADVKVGLIQYKSVLFEIEYNPTLWTRYGGGVYHRQLAQVNLNYIGEYGIFSFFWGYNFYEDQPVRPKPHRAIIGFRWEM